MEAARSGALVRAMVGRVAAVVTAAGVVVLCASGCAGPVPPIGVVPPGGSTQPAAVPPVGDAPILTTVDCRSESSSAMMFDPSATPDPSIPVPGRVPDGFEASAALLCVVELPPIKEVELAPTDGAELEVALQIERHEGDLDTLLAALAESDDEAPDDIVCTADMELVPALWLEDSAGRVVPVHYPRDVCGKTKQAVRDALGDLEVTAVEPWSIP